MLVVIFVEPSAAVSEPKEVVVHIRSGVLAEINAADSLGNNHGVSFFDINKDDSKSPASIMRSCAKIMALFDVEVP